MFLERVDKSEYSEAQYKPPLRHFKSDLNMVEAFLLSEAWGSNQSAPQIKMLTGWWRLSILLSGMRLLLPF
jgi:hypothetical protein